MQQLLDGPCCPSLSWLPGEWTRWPKREFLFLCFWWLYHCMSWTEEIHNGRRTRVQLESLAFCQPPLALCFSVPRTSLNLRVSGPGCVRGNVPDGEELMKGWRPAQPSHRAWHSCLAVAREPLASTPPVSHTAESRDSVGRCPALENCVAEVWEQWMDRMWHGVVENACAQGLVPISIGAF